MLPRTLSAQAPGGSAGSVGKPRMAFFYVPNGVNDDEWIPKDDGPNWTMSKTLEVLKDFRADLTVMTGLGHIKASGGHDGGDTWLTGADVRSTPGKDYQNSISVDQVAAEVVGKETRHPSLELSFHGGTGTPLHSHTLSFDRAGTALPTENNVQRLFDRLFTADDQATRAATLRRYGDQRSILDEVTGEARSLNRKLGKADQRKIDEYLGSVRETEQRIQRLQDWVDRPKPEVSRNGLNLNVLAHPLETRPFLETMLDLCWLAFQTDTTRVIAFEWSREAHGWGEHGEDHHALSHHNGDPSMLAQVGEVDRFHVRMLARFLGKLRQAQEAGGTMLDSTMVLFGSGMSNGKGGGHSPQNLPTLLAGGRKLGLRHGSHLKYEIDSTPLANVLLTMLNAMGVRDKKFMDSTGPLKGLV